MVSMKLKNLHIENFRNCDDLCLDLDFDKVIIIGKNAQGKTNILESIYFLSTLKSPRTSNIKDFVQFGKEKFSLECELEKANSSVDLAIDYTLNKTKNLKLNGLRTTAKNYRSVLNTVLFSTKDLLLLRGTPQDRRDWLDTAISQIYPAHDERLSKYNKIRIQKNNLLKENEINQTLLDVFNEQLAVVGANIIFVRQKFLSELRKHALDTYSGISTNEQFSFEYSFKHFEIDDIANSLRLELEERRAEEIARHQSCVGPH